MLNINNERLHIHNHSSYIIGSLPPSGWTVNCTSNKYMILFCHYHSLWSGTLYLFGKSFFIILGKTLWLQQLLFNRLLLMKSWYCMSWLCLCVRVYSDNVKNTILMPEFFLLWLKFIHIIIIIIITTATSLSCTLQTTDFTII